jgi:microsomal dipeptidase-like Zn-dependent dipeptidase
VIRYLYYYKKRETYVVTDFIDLERMSKYKKYIQVFALFVDVKKIDCNPLVYTLKILDRLHYEINANSDLIELAFCYDDILSILSKGKCVGVISLEGGEALCGELSTLKILHKLVCTYDESYMEL